MKFKGDILITDPCYFIKDERNNKVNPPKREDFFTHKSIKDYEDFKINPLLESDEIKGLFDNSTLNVMSDILSTSKIREEENKKYQEALTRYEKTYGTDWEKTDYGENLNLLGFTSYLSSDTLYGDWDCITVDSNINKQLGTFCADAGKVVVCLVNEIKTYNAEALEKLGHCATIIKDFDGDIDFKTNNTGELSIVGLGNINFYTKQI